jgi:hypothetical protein
MSQWRGRDRAVCIGVERQAATGAEAVVAAVNRGTARARCDPNFAQDRHRPVVAQAIFEPAQLGVDLAQRRKLGEYQWVVALAKAVQIEYESAEVAVGKLTRLAQEAGATTHSPALAKARRRWGLLGGRLGLWRLLLGALRGVIGRGRRLLNA